MYCTTCTSQPLTAQITKQLFWIPSNFMFQDISTAFNFQTLHSISILPLKWQKFYMYTGCHRRNGPNFGRVFLMLNYTDITQNTYIQSWTVMEIMAREKCGHLAFLRTVCLQLCSALTVREQCGAHFCDYTSSAQRDKIAFHYCWYVQCLVNLRKTVIWLRVFL